MKNKTLKFGGCIDLFSMALTPDESGKVVIDVPVLPLGKFKHARYGDLEWTTAKFARMIANYNSKVTGYEPMLNADHATGNPMAPQAEAYGWPQELFTKPDGLYAKVDLTDLGITAVEKRRYRYISAEVADRYSNSLGEEYRDVIVGMALTNTPFHDTMPSLFSGVEVPTFTAQQFATLEGDLSYEEIRRMLSKAVREEVRTVPHVYRYLREVFPGFCIYEEYNYSSEEECCYYRRDYTIADRTVTLGDTSTEVEEVWVSKVQENAQMSRREFHRTNTKDTAGALPASGDKRMSGQAKKSAFQTFMDAVFGDKETLTKEEFAAKAKAEAVTPVVEPVKPMETMVGVSFSQKDFDSLQEKVTALSTRLDQSEADRQKVQTELSKERAKSVVAEYTRMGKILPAQSDQEEAIEFALADPVRFKKVYDKAAPVVDLKEYGTKFGASSEPEMAGNPTHEFNEAVSELMDQGKDYLEASDIVARENPDLYERHRVFARKG